jgi:hypothetical protein
MAGYLVRPQLPLLVAVAIDLACAKTTPMALTPEGAHVRVSDSTLSEVRVRRRLRRGHRSQGQRHGPLGTQPGAQPRR